MANCKELHVIGSPAYKDCLEKNKNVIATENELEADVTSLYPTETVKNKDNILFTKTDTGKLNFETQSLFRINKTTARDGEEIKSFLEEFSSEVSGLSYDLERESVNTGMGVSSKGLKKLRLSYKNKDGKSIKSDLINFGSLEETENNLNKIKDFFNENLTETDLNLLNKSLKQKGKIQSEKNNGTISVEKERELLTRISSDAGFRSLYTIEEGGKPDENGNPKLIPNLSVFDPYEKTVLSSGIYVGPSKKETIYPYEKELEVNLQKLTNANLNLDTPRNAEEILKQAKEDTIRDITVSTLNEAKTAKRNEENDESLENQATSFIGNAVLKTSLKTEFIKKNEEANTSANNLNVYEKVLDLANKITSNNGTVEDYKTIEENIALLNLNVSSGSFKSGMSMEDYVKQGGAENENLKNLNDVTLKNGVKTTRDFLATYKNVYQNAKAEQGLFKKRQVEIADLISGMEDSDLALNLAGKNYSDIDKYMRNIGGGFADIGFNIAYGTGKTLNFVGKLYNSRFNVWTGQNLKQMLGSNSIDKALDSLAVDYVEETESIRDSFQPNISFEDAFNSPGKFGSFMVNELTTQIPIFATMMATGGYGALVIGASSGAGKRATMAHEIATGKKEYSITELILKPIGYAAAEGLIAHYTTVPILKANKLRFTQMFKKSDVVDNGVKAYWKEQALSGFVYEPLLEAGGEALTTGFQNLLDGNPFTANMGHSAFSGFSMSLIMSGSSFSYGSYMSRNSDWKTRNELRKEQKQLDNLSLQRQDFNRKLNDGRYSAVNKKNFKSAINTIDGDIKNQHRLVENAMDKIESIVKNNYREGHATDIKNSLKAQTILQNKAQDILNNNAFSDKQKSDQVKILSVEFQRIQNEMDTSLSENNMMKFRPEFDLLENAFNEDGTPDFSKQDKFSDYLNESASVIQNKGGNISIENIRRGAYELYVRDVVKESNIQAGKNKFAKLNFTQLDTVEQAIDWINNDSKFSDENKLKAIENIKNDADGFADKDTNTTVVVVENQVKNQRKFTGVHEIGHQLFWNIFSRNSAAFEPIAQQLLKTTKEIDSKLYEKIIAETQKDDNGNLMTQEVIMRFLEAAAGGEIKMIQKASGWKGLFGVMVQQEFDNNFDYNFDFKGETDIVNWVIGLGNKLKDGSLDRDQLNEAEQTAGFFMKVTDTQGEVEANSDGIAFSEGDLKSQFDNKFVIEGDTYSTKLENEDGERKFNSKEDFKNSPEKRNLQMLIELTPTLDGSIRNLPGVSQAYLDMQGNETYIEDVKKRISDKAMSEFNPALNESFFGWLTGKNVTGKSIIELAAGDIQIKNKKKVSTTPIDSSTRQIADPGSNTNTDSTTDITPIIDVMNFAKKVNPKITQKEIDALSLDFQNQIQSLAKQKNIDITKDNLTNKELMAVTPYGILADLVGIDIKKLQNPNQNLDKPTSLKAQKLLLAARPFIKNVVLGQSSKKTQKVDILRDGKQIIDSKTNKPKQTTVGGETLNLGRNIQKIFFNPPKRVGNNYVRTPKKFDNKVFDKAIGTKSGLVDKNYIPQSSESQVIKALLKAVTEQMTNRSLSAVLDIKEDKGEITTPVAAAARVNLKRGTNDLVFSSAKISKAQNLIKNSDNKTFYENNINEFIAIIAETGNVEQAFNEVYKDMFKGKVQESLIKAWDDVNVPVAAKILELENGKKIKVSQQEFLLNKFDEAQEIKSLKERFGIKKEGIDYSNKDQLENMNDFLKLRIEKYRKAGKSEAEIYKIFDLERSTYAGSSKVGTGKYIWVKNSKGNFKLKNNPKFKTDKDGKVLGVFNFKKQAQEIARVEKDPNKTDEQKAKEIEFLKKETKYYESGQRYGLYTNKTMMKVLGLTKPKGYKSDTKIGQTKNAYINSLRKSDNNTIDPALLTKSDEYAKKNRKAFFELLDSYKKLTAKEQIMFKNAMGMALASSYRGTKTLIRESAAVDSIAETDFSEDYGQYRYEHNPPASQMALYAADYLNGNMTKKQLEAEFDKFAVTIIPLTMDTILDEVYQSSVPANPNLGRYGRTYNFNTIGKIPFVTKRFIKVDGKWETKTYGDLAPQQFAIREAEINAKKVKKDGEIYFSKPQNQPIYPNPETLSNEFNTIIEQTLGVDAGKRFSDIVAKRRGAKKGLFRPFVPPSMEDFQGLMYDLYTKGTLGEQQMKWVKDNLIDPYQKGVANIDVYRQTLKQDYKALLKKFPNVKKNLGKTVPGTDFTQDQAIRVNLWTKAGYEIPGISKRDVKKLNDFVNKNPELGLFGEGAVLISKQKNWSKPDPYWDVQSILSDLDSFTNNVGRQQFLEQFNANVEAIFSKENMNKLEASLGTNWRSAMEDSLYRMQTGTNRPSGADKLVNRFMNWTNNSIGAIMFFNRKSALLQTISSVNFLNWSDNNPVKAAMAFANFPQFIKDFAFLWNSPKLKQRRSGLRSDVNEAEIANAVRGATNKAQAMLSYLLKLGFTPTQLADSFAIASGGATFYRNRFNTYTKDGLSEVDAQKKAFEDFSAASEVSQQSADPMFISQQQAGVLGRLLLAFQNTPAQVTRLFKKATRDFINIRGDQKTNLSKMVYYGAVQGFIFAALQNAIFIGIDEEEEEESAQMKKELKQSRIINSMTDTLLRGSGVYGAIVATLKNTINVYYREKGKSAFAKDNAAVLLELANLSPPIGSKLRKINNALKTEDYKQDVMDKMNYDVTYKGKVILSPKYNIIASIVEGLSNVPLERAMNEFLALSEMMDQRNSTLQRIALALGYRSWDVGAKIEEFDEIIIEAKEDRAKASKEKSRLKREEAARLKEAEKYKGKTEEQIAYIKRYDIIMKQRKPEQVKTLSELGLTTKQIKALKYEKDRAKKIIELQNKKQ